MNPFKEYLDLEPGWDFLYINNNAQSSMFYKLVSIDQDEVDLRFTSDWIFHHYNGLKMTVMLGDYGTHRNSKRLVSFF